MSPTATPGLSLHTNIVWIFGILDFWIFKGLWVPHPQGWRSLTPLFHAFAKGAFPEEYLSHNFDEYCLGVLIGAFLP